MTGLKVLLKFQILLILLGTIAGDEICSAKDVDGDIVYPHESDCRKFYKCEDGAKLELTCVGDFYFNSVTNLCDRPENTNCSSKTTNRYSLRIYPHRSDCSKFYLLVKHKLTEHRCPTDLHFNAELQVCDYKLEAKCQIN